MRNVQHKSAVRPVTSNSIYVTIFRNNILACTELQLVSKTNLAFPFSTTLENCFLLFIKRFQRCQPTRLLLDLAQRIGHIGTVHKFLLGFRTPIKPISSTLRSDQPLLRTLADRFRLSLLRFCKSFFLFSDRFPGNGQKFVSAQEDDTRYLGATSDHGAPHDIPHCQHSRSQFVGEGCPYFFH